MNAKQGPIKWWVRQDTGGEGVVGYGVRGSGGDGWGPSKRRTRHEIEWEWRTEKSLLVKGGGRRLWDRDGETESEDRMRVRERLTYCQNSWCLLRCAATWLHTYICISTDDLRWVYEVYILHLSDLWRSTCQCRRHWRGRNLGQLYQELHTVPEDVSSAVILLTW